MANMMKMLKQAQAMQKNMEKMQSELADREVEFSAGGGMIKVVSTCEGNVQSIRIDPKVVDPDDVEMLEDLVLTAVQGAVQLGKDSAAEEMAKVTQGLELPPGMNLPF